jgi:hypothetical protein
MKRKPRVENRRKSFFLMYTTNPAPGTSNCKNELKNELAIQIIKHVKAFKMFDSHANQDDMRIKVACESRLHMRRRDGMLYSLDI